MLARKFGWVCLLIVLSVPTAARADSHCRSEATHPGELHLWTGGANGYYYQVGRAIAAAASHSHDLPKIHYCDSDGSVSNLKALASGEADFAIVQSDAALSAWHCEEPLGSALHCRNDKENGKAAKLEVISPLFLEKAQILLRPHLYISSLGDLRSAHCVWVGPKGSGSESTARMLLESSGWTKEQIEHSQTSCQVHPTSIEEALGYLKRADELDAIIQTRVAPTKPIYDALRDSEVQMLSLDSATMDRVTRDGVYQMSAIHRIDYPNIPDGVSTVGVQALLMTRNDVDPDAIRALARIIQDEQDDIQKHLERNLEVSAGASGNPDVDTQNVKTVQIVDPIVLALIGTRPAANLAKYVDRDADEYLWHYPLRRATLIQLSALIVFFCSLVAFLRYHKKGRKFFQGYYREVIFFAGVATSWVFTSVWVQATDGPINEHFYTLSQSAGSVAANVISKLPVQLFPAPSPTTQSGQTVVSIFSYFGFLMLTVYALPTLRKSWVRWGGHVLGLEQASQGRSAVTSKGLEEQTHENRQAKSAKAGHDN
jgi:TRAP transporter TAXI family solute receptor